MTDFWAANEPFAVSASIIILGYILKRSRILDESVGESLARVALNVTLPAIILVNVPDVDMSGINIMLPLFTIVSSFLMALLAFYVFKQRPVGERGLGMSASVGYNIGLFAFPLVAGLYGKSGLQRFALIDLGNAIAIFGFSYYLAYRYSPLRDSKRLGITGILRLMFSSIPFVTYLFAIGLNLLGLKLTGTVANIVAVPAAMNRGVSLLVLGILMRFRFSPDTLRTIIPSLALRYLFGSAAAALCLFVLPMSVEIRVALAGVMILPVGLTIIPFSVKWGYNRDSAAAILNLGIPISFVLFWLVWAAGTYWL